MNFLHLTPQRGLSKYLLLPVVSGCLCLASCKDDMSRTASSPQVAFTTAISASWKPLARSAGDEPKGTVTALEGGSGPLYLHTIYTDSIDSPSPDTTILSRAAPIRNDNMYQNFGVSAYSYAGAWDETQTPDFFHNATASKSGTGYTLSPTYNWPGASYKMKFFAYAPKDNPQYVLSGSTHAGSPTLSVTVPGNVQDQKDLLVAKTDELEGDANTAVPLTFHHALTAIKFVCGDDMQEGTVKSVCLKNVCSKGTFHMGTQSWSDVDTPADFTQTLDKATAGNAGEALTTEAQTFMMVPQTLPEGARLEVVFTDSSNADHTLTADIKGTEWPAGKTVTYKISHSSINWSYTLAVSGPANFTYTGGTQQYNVTSYRQNTGGEKEAVRWTAQYSEDDGTSWSNTRPDWLADFTASGDGGDTPQSYDATVSAQDGIESNPHTILQKAAEKGSAGAPYNLANQTDGGTTDENTANCYVVSAPGHYSFPPVYGNAIKNSTTNVSAYTSKATGDSILNPFINHTGKGITDPYISKNAGCNPTKAELVWQDAPNLVTDIQYNSAGNGTVSFTIDRSNIRQGNAVIALKDAGDNVLWSWHIWVTDEDISQTIEITNFQNYKYKFMPVNLGWCDSCTTTYGERSCKIKFTAEKQSKEITVKQVREAIFIGDNYTYYQWGRKDPISPARNFLFDNEVKTWYDQNGTPSTRNFPNEHFPKGAECIKNYILKPNVRHDGWGDRTYANLWSANNSTYTVNDDPVVKTVYDPSPVGFQLPPSNAFSGFTINGTWDYFLKVKGCYFYTDSSKKQSIFFPTVGNVSNVVGIDFVGREGHYWSAAPGSRIEGRLLRIYLRQQRYYLLSKCGRSYGTGVRPIEE